MYGYIYKNTCLINNKIYIGQHKYNKKIIDESYWGSGVIFIDALNKYGKDNWIREIIDTANSEEELNNKEIFWISKYYQNGIPDFNIGYNLTTGGECGRMPGFKWYTNGIIEITISDNQIPDGFLPGMSESHKQAYRDYISSHHEELSKRTLGENNPFYGKHHTDETKNLLREINIGREDSLEVREKKRIATTLLWNDENYKNSVLIGLDRANKRPEVKIKRSNSASGKNNPMSRRVLCVENKLIFDTVAEASNWLKNLTGHAGAIGRSCTKGTATMGYHFKYCDDKSPKYASGRKYNYIRPESVSNKVSESLKLYHKDKNK